MVRYASFLFFCLITTVSVKAASGPDAIQTLARVEHLLVHYQKSGYAAVADEILRLVQMAKAAGVTNQAVLVGHHDKDGGGAEFGVADGGLRLFPHSGRYRPTAVALRVSFKTFHNGNSFVMFRIRISERTTAFGVAGKEFTGLVEWTAERSAQLSLNFPQDHRRLGDETKERERVFRLMPVPGRGDCVDAFWAKYTLRENGVTIVHR